MPIQSVVIDHIFQRTKVGENTANSESNYSCTTSFLELNTKIVIKEI